MGLEVIEASDNWNYSRGLLFGYFDPFWHQGVKISYPFGDSLSATVLVVNGWNNSYDFTGNLRDPFLPLHAAFELEVDLKWPVQYEHAKRAPVKLDSSKKA